MYQPLFGQATSTFLIAHDVNVTTPVNEPVTVTLSGTGAGELTGHIVNQPTNGVLGLIDQQTGTVEYTPSVNFVGKDTFTYLVNDGKKDSKVATVEINVGTTSVDSLSTLGTSNASESLQLENWNEESEGLPQFSNHPPKAQDQQVTVNNNTVAEIILSASDQDSNQLTATIVDSPSNGILSDIDQETGTVTYTPSQDFVGEDVFTFKVNDGTTDSINKGTVSIYVSGDSTKDSATQRSQESNQSNAMSLKDSSFVIYENTETGIKVGYPDGWNILEVNKNSSARYNKVVEFSSADQLANVWITIDNADSTNVDLIKSFSESIRLDKTNLAEERFADMSILETRTDAYLSGSQAYMIEYTFTEPDIGTFKEKQLATISDGKGYIITYSSDIASYPMYLSDAQKIFDSFSITDKGLSQEINDDVIDIYYDYEWLADPLNVYIVASQDHPQSLQYVDDATSAVKKWSVLLKKYSGSENAWNFNVYTSSKKLDLDINGDVITAFEPPAHIIIELKPGGQGQERECLQDSGRADPFPVDPNKPVYAHVFTSCFDEISSYDSYHTDVYTTVLHEFAHELGLGHTFNKDGDLMCSHEEGKPTCSVYYGRIEPSELDLKALLYRYGTNGFSEPNQKFELTDDYRYKYKPPS